MGDYYYVIEWYKECYPFPDDCEKKTFGTKQAAKTFCDVKKKEGCLTRLIAVSIFNDDDEGDWI